MKKIFTLIMLIALPALSMAQRNPLTWPFAKTSIWNMPIHDQAVYVPATIREARYFEADEDVIIMTPDQPEIKVMTNRAGWSHRDRCVVEGPELFSAPIPKSFIYDKNVWHGRTPNAGVAILLKNGYIKQTQPFAKCGTDVATSEHVWPESSCVLKGECVEGAHGGAGLSAIGGAIRYGEFSQGAIRHVLKINLWGKYNFYKGYRWPAVKADGGFDDPTAFNYYGGTNPEMRIGALLALHKKETLASLKENSLGLETEPGLIIARALQNYGAYTVDNTAGDYYAFIVEIGPHGSVRKEFKSRFGYDLNVDNLKSSAWGRDIDRIFRALYVISNNTDPRHIGGGPTGDFKNRRAPMAPDFID